MTPRMPRATGHYITESENTDWSASLYFGDIGSFHPPTSSLAGAVAVRPLISKPQLIRLPRSGKCPADSAPLTKDVAWNREHSLIFCFTSFLSHNFSALTFLAYRTLLGEVSIR